MKFGLYAILLSVAAAVHLRAMQKAEVEKPITLDEAKKIVKEFDKNGDGDIDWDEFKKFIERKNKGHRFSKG